METSHKTDSPVITAVIVYHRAVTTCRGESEVFKHYELKFTGLNEEQEQHWSDEFQRYCGGDYTFYDGMNHSEPPHHHICWCNAMHHFLNINDFECTHTDYGYGIKEFEKTLDVCYNSDGERWVHVPNVYRDNRTWDEV